MRSGVLTATLVMSLTLTTPATGGEPTDTLRRLFEHANRILLAPDATDEVRFTALRALVREAFDAREAAALALGRVWTSQTAAERDEFSRLYGDVIESAYVRGVGARARLHADGIRVAFGAESVQGTHATVVTTVETRDGGAMPVEYRLHRGERGWAVVDVLVEGLSLAASYRAQIQRVMQSGTYSDLLARLREKASAATLAAIATAKTSATAYISPSPAPVGSAATSFWIQVGAFRDTDAASRVMQRLRGLGVMLAIGGPGPSPLARVLVGPFTNRAAAASTLRALTAGGYPAFIAVE